MSTLKKILSLSLALAMLMSVSVFAGFADADEIDKDAAAAVELLTAVKILNGIPQEDGTTDFAPTATIKRAEAAKMIYVLRNGGVDDGAATWKGVVSFEDCKDHWAAGYIAYCEAYGLINGRTETVFDPEAPVTGIELAKMLLTTAGYKTDAEGFTGTGWEKSVVAEANAVNLFAGVKFAISEAAPRQWAAVMFKNAFDVTVPVYIGDYRVDGILNGVTPVKVKAQYLNYDDSLITYVLATATAAMPGEAKAASGKTTLASGTVDFVVADALVGQQVKVTKINNKIVSIAATGKTVMGKLTIGAKVTASGENQNKYPIYIDGALWGYRAGDANLTITNVAAGVTGIAASESKTVAALKEAIEAKTTAYTVYGYDKDGNNEALEAAIAVTTEYGTVGTISTATATKGDFAVGSYNVDVSSSNVTVEGTMKKDIVVKVSKDMFTGKVTVAPADMVVGSFTGVSGSKYTVNGEQFEISAKAISGQTSFLATTNLKKTAVLYTDGKYVVLAKEFVADSGSTDTEVTALPTNLALLIAAQDVITSTTSTDDWGNVSDTPVTVLKVQVLLDNGTMAYLPYEDSTSTSVVKAADLSAAELKAAINGFTGGVFEYTLTSNGKILFKEVIKEVDNYDYYANDAKITGDLTANGDMGIEVTYNATSKLLTAKNDGKTLANFVMATENTKVFVIYTNDEPGKTAKTEYKVMKLADLTAYEIDELKLIAATDATIGEGLLATAEVSYKVPSTPTATAVDHYVIATSAVDYVVEGDKIYKVFTAIDLKNGCAAATFKAEVKNSGETNTDAVKKGAILKIETTSNLVTKAEAATGWTVASIQAKVSDLLLVNGEIWQNSKFDSNCKVILKNGDAYTTGTVANLVEGKAITGGGTENNIMYALVGGTGTNKDKVAYVIIDLDGKIEFTDGAVK